MLYELCILNAHKVACAHSAVYGTSQDSHFSKQITEISATAGKCIDDNIVQIWADLCPVKMKRYVCFHVIVFSDK